MTVYIIQVMLKNHAVTMVVGDIHDLDIHVRLAFNINERDWFSILNAGKTLWCIVRHTLDKELDLLYMTI